MVHIDEGPGDARHKRLLAEQEKRRRAEVRGGRAYVLMGLVFLALGAVGLVFFGLDGDVLGISLSAAMVCVGGLSAAFGKVIVLCFRKPKPPDRVAAEPQDTPEDDA